MNKREKAYVTENMNLGQDLVVEVSESKVTGTVLMFIKGNQGTIYKLNEIKVEKDDKTKEKVIDGYEKIRTITLPTNQEVTKDKLALSTDYIFNGEKVKVIMSDDTKKFEQYLLDNGNTIVDTERKFKDKILGFRSNTGWKKVVAVIGYILLAIALVSFTVDALTESDEEKAQIAQEKKEQKEWEQEQQAKADKAIADDKAKEKAEKEKKAQAKADFKKKDDMFYKLLNENAEEKELFGATVVGVTRSLDDPDFKYFNIKVKNSVKGLSQVDKQSLADNIGRLVLNVAYQAYGYDKDTPISIDMTYENGEKFAESKHNEPHQYIIKN